MAKVILELDPGLDPAPMARHRPKTTGPAGTGLFSTGVPSRWKYEAQTRWDEDLMIRQLALAVVLVALTTTIHSLCTAAAIGIMRRLQLDQRRMPIPVSGTILTAGLVVTMFSVAILEAALYAVTYVKVRAMPNFEAALYFSVVTFTSLGYGDVVVDQRWRLLAAAEAANGIMMFGWTTGLIVAVLARLVEATRKS